MNSEEMRYEKGDLPASTGDDGDLVSETGSVWGRHVLISFGVCKRVLIVLGRMSGRRLKEKKKEKEVGKGGSSALLYRIMHSSPACVW